LEKHAGKRGKCPKCQALIKVPAMAPVANSKPSEERDPAARNPTAQLDMKDVLEAFQGDIAPVRTTLVYRIGIVAVTIAMMILPLLYIAMIAAVGYAVVWHAINNAGTIGKIRNIWGILMVYV